ncbi:hypothetical protein O3M35_006617 [Rhynocoris fuscipes]|uniref:Uncharacterized protein n=1 Tax=Rhynocoris fuscipes TaxID=488301 RepID=A0AAW1DEQ3_9HEMI
MNFPESPIDLESVDSHSNVPGSSSRDSIKPKKKCRKSLPPTRQSLRIREREEQLKTGGTSGRGEPITSQEYQDKFQLTDKVKSKRLSKQSVEYPSTSHRRDDFLRASHDSNSGAKLPPTKRTSYIKSPQSMEYPNVSYVRDDQMRSSYVSNSGAKSPSPQRTQVIYPSTSYLRDDDLRPNYCRSANLLSIQRGDMDMASDYREIPRPPHLTKEQLNIEKSRKEEYTRDLLGKRNLFATFLIVVLASWIGYHNDECCKIAISKIVFFGVVIVLVINALDIIFRKIER